MVVVCCGLGGAPQEPEADVSPHEVVWLSTEGEFTPHPPELFAPHPPGLFAPHPPGLVAGKSECMDIGESTMLVLYSGIISGSGGRRLGSANDGPGFSRVDFFLKLRFANIAFLTCPPMGSMTAGAGLSVLLRGPASFAFVEIPWCASPVVGMGIILTLGSLFLWLTAGLGGGAGAKDGPALAVDGPAALVLALLFRPAVPVEGCGPNLRCPILTSGDEGAENSEPALSLSCPSLCGEAARGREGVFSFSFPFPLPHKMSMRCPRTHARSHLVCNFGFLGYFTKRLIRGRIRLTVYCQWCPGEHCAVPCTYIVRL